MYRCEEVPGSAARLPQGVRAGAPTGYVFQVWPGRARGGLLPSRSATARQPRSDTAGKMCFSFPIRSIKGNCLLL
jgi:hypothetical protein